MTTNDMQCICKAYFNIFVLIAIRVQTTRNHCFSKERARAHTHSSTQFRAFFDLNEKPNGIRCVCVFNSQNSIESISREEKKKKNNKGGRKQQKHKQNMK